MIVAALAAATTTKAQSIAVSGLGIEDLAGS